MKRADIVSCNSHKCENPKTNTIVAPHAIHPQGFCRLIASKMTCSYCGGEISCLLLCGQCQKRRYCSKQCRAADWCSGMGQGHQRYCGRGGELGVDFELHDFGPPKGIGVVALRHFGAHEPILVDRALTSKEFLLDNREVCDTLMPQDGERVDRFHLNAMGSGSHGDALRVRKKGEVVLVLLAVFPADRLYNDWLV